MSIAWVPGGGSLRTLIESGPLSEPDALWLSLDEPPFSHLSIECFVAPRTSANQLTLSPNRSPSLKRLMWSLGLKCPKMFGLSFRRIFAPYVRYTT
jgi:hypothetical protein